jgi:hypothetical protein
MIVVQEGQVVFSAVEHACVSLPTVQQGVKDDWTWRKFSRH